MKQRPNITPDQNRETFFRVLIDHLHGGMVVLDARGVVQFANSAACEFLSAKLPDFKKSFLRIDSLNSHHVLRLPGQDMADAVPCKISSFIWEGEPHTLAIIRDAGEEVTEADLAPIDGDQGQSESNYKKFFEHAVNGFVLARVVRDSAGEPVDFEFVQVNRAFERLLNLSGEAIMGKSARLFLPNIGKMAVWEALKDVVQSGQAVRVKTYSDIYDRYFKLSIFAPMEGYIGVIFNDITQQVEAENELSQNEAKFRALFDAMALGVVIQDREGNIVSANTAVQRILGLSHGNLIGMGSLNTDWGTVKLNGETLRGKDHPAMTALRTGRRVDDFILGLRNSQKNTRKWLSVSAVPEFRNGDSESYQVITTFMDITDRIRVQRAFEERVKELRCLTNISSLLQRNPSIEDVCQRKVIELISALNILILPLQRSSCPGKNAQPIRKAIRQ
ncbi:MAG: PAS domain S-box protein [Brevefilum sp.]